jgi:hypothetical protein
MIYQLWLLQPCFAVFGVFRANMHFRHDKIISPISFCNYYWPGLIMSPLQFLHPWLWPNILFVCNKFLLLDFFGLNFNYLLKNVIIVDVYILVHETTRESENWDNSKTVGLFIPWKVSFARVYKYSRLLFTKLISPCFKARKRIVVG